MKNLMIAAVVAMIASPVLAGAEFDVLQNGEVTFEGVMAEFVTDCKAMPVGMVADGGITAPTVVRTSDGCVVTGGDVDFTADEAAAINELTNGAVVIAVIAGDNNDTFMVDFTKLN